MSDLKEALKSDGWTLKNLLVYLSETTGQNPTEMQSLTKLLLLLLMLLLLLLLCEVVVAATADAVD